MASREGRMVSPQCLSGTLLRSRVKGTKSLPSIVVSDFLEFHIIMSHYLPRGE